MVLKYCHFFRAVHLSMNPDKRHIFFGLKRMQRFSLSSFSEATRSYHGSICSLFKRDDSFLFPEMFPLYLLFQVCPYCAEILLVLLSLPCGCIISGNIFTCPGHTYIYLHVQAQGPMVS